MFLLGNGRGLDQCWMKTVSSSASLRWLLGWLRCEGTMCETMLCGCSASGCSEILGDGCRGEPTDGAAGIGNSEAAVELWMPYKR